MSAADRPHVVVHTAVSADGRIDGFTPRIDVFYALARSFDEDVTLAGSGTILAAASASEGAPGVSSGDATPEGTSAPEGSSAPASRRARPGISEQRGLSAGGETPAAPTPALDGPLLAVPDSRGRISDWAWLRRAGIWRDLLALSTRSTPAEHLDALARAGVACAICGERHVDLAAALALLAREHGARVVRVDSGGRLSGALLRAGLVDELSLLVHPVVVGGRSPRSAFVADDLAAGTAGTALGEPLVEALESGLVWLRWPVLAGRT